MYSLLPYGLAFSVVHLCSCSWFLCVGFVFNRFCQFLICIFLSPGIYKLDKTVDDTSMLGHVSDLRLYAF